MASYSSTMVDRTETSKPPSTSPAAAAELRRSAKAYRTSPRERSFPTSVATSYQSTRMSAAMRSAR